MTEAMIGYNTKYFIGSGGSPETFDELAEVFNVTPGEATADRIDATHMQSPGRRREYITGLIDGGEATIELNWVPGSDTDQLIRELFESGASRSHRIQFPNGTTVTYPGIITGYSKAIPLDDKLTATITVAVSGDETWSA